jgi:hypothetical protein
MIRRLRNLAGRFAEWIAPTMPDDLLALARATGVYIEDQPGLVEHTIPGGQPLIEWAMSTPLDPRHNRELNDASLASFVAWCERTTS